MGASVEEFYADLERDTNFGETLPTWHGELYLEVCDLNVALVGSNML